MFFKAFLSPAVYAMQAVTNVRHAQTTASKVACSKVSFHWQGVASVWEVSSVLSRVDVGTDVGE